MKRHTILRGTAFWKRLTLSERTGATRGNRITDKETPLTVKEPQQEKDPIKILVPEKGGFTLGYLQARPHRKHWHLTSPAVAIINLTEIPSASRKMPKTLIVINAIIRTRQAVRVGGNIPTVTDRLVPMKETLVSLRMLPKTNHRHPQNRWRVI